MQHIFLKGTVTLLLLLLVTSLALGQVSVPNQINFQGRLTDASGNPVADGVHTVNFTLWTLPAAGTNVWTENTSQTTSGGLFTHNLGSLTAFSATLFENNDSLFLQIVADGQTITPRIRLTSSPYARLANNIETYGSDGEPNIQTGGASWGEIWLNDSDPANYRGVALGAYSNGGALYLDNNVGATVISLDAGLTGDASALLLSNAVNAGEMSNEPGIAHDFSSRTITLAAVDSVLDSVVVAAPTSGYVVVLATLLYQPNHTTGTRTILRSSISTSQSLDFTYLCNVTWGSNHETASDAPHDCAITRVEPVSAGNNKFFLIANRYSGAGSVIRYQFTAMFYPTAYGTVALNALASGNTIIPDPSNSDGGLSASWSGKEKNYITLQEHNAMVEAEVAKAKAELEARLLKLEQRLDKQGAGVE